MLEEVIRSIKISIAAGAALILAGCEPPSQTEAPYNYAGDIDDGVNVIKLVDYSDTKTSDSFHHLFSF